MIVATHIMPKALVENSKTPIRMELGKSRDTRQPTTNDTNNKDIQITIQLQTR
jgi:hypothetical protein